MQNMLIQAKHDETGEWENLDIEVQSTTFDAMAEIVTILHMTGFSVFSVMTDQGCTAVESNAKREVCYDLDIVAH